MINFIFLIHLHFILLVMQHRTVRDLSKQSVELYVIHRNYNEKKNLLSTKMSH